ncbi:MAG TPA: T9SS type A sorting domain-containing protein [Flavobacteriales bacterium]|nr:T9SS type A sorting domain-containing protein [Flavobacteriales bacterium]
MNRSLLLATGSILLGIQSLAVTVSINVLEYPLCGLAYGVLSANASGGVGPYTYLWSTGSPDQQIFGLPPGTYSVTVTDFNGEQATDEVTITEQPLYGSMPLWLPGCPDPGFPNGPGRRLFIDGWPSSVGMAPWTNSEGWAMTPVSGGLITPVQFLYLGADLYQPGQSFDFTVTDANGCQIQVEGVAPPYPEYIEPQLLDVSGACSDGANGSLTVFAPAEPFGWTSTLKLLREGGNEYGWGSDGWNVVTGSAPRTLHATGLPAGTYHIVQMPYWDNFQDMLELYFPGIDDPCRDTLTVVVPDLGYTCGTLSGRAFVDANENCMYGATDAYLPNTVIEVQPGDHYAITSNTGLFTMNLPYGAYTIADQNPLFQEHCGVEGVPFTISSGQANVTRNLADTSLTGLDVRLSIGSGAARPGFQIGYGLDVDNLTGVLSGAGTLTFTHDPTLIYLNTGTPASSVVDNVITWNISSMGAFADRDFSAYFQVPPDIGLLGQVLASSATVSVSGAETDLSNNTALHTVTVTGSYDPNDKTVRTTTGAEGLYLIDGDDRLDYTIRFQNTGTDTAFFVVITDTLQATLDPATFQLGAASHPMTMLMRDNVLKFMFANILLPDSNANEPRSHGFVTYSIEPLRPILPGTEIENIANIFFDYNPPVITEPSVLVAEFSTGFGEQDNGHVQLWPNPATDHVWIRAMDAIRSIRVMTMDGREVLRSSPSTREVQVATDHLAPGSYLFEVRSNAGQVTRTTIIKIN